MKDKKPLILVVNDDGVMAPGIRNLAAVASEYGEVVVVAPDKPQSGMGHAITINATLRVNEIKNYDGIRAFSTSGTPVDCVKLAVCKLLDRKPDLLLSGINHGANHSINVIYSGTMSAAIEGALEGIPSVGFSLLDYSIDADFSASKIIAGKVIEQLLKEKTPKGVCFNVNIPKLKYEEIAGIKVCRQANAIWKEELDERKDPSGNTYYWLTGVFQNLDEGDDTDIWALKNNYVSVVPTQFDLTAYEHLPKLKKIFA